MPVTANGLQDSCDGSSCFNSFFLPSYVCSCGVPMYSRSTAHAGQQLRMYTYTHTCTYEQTCAHLPASTGTTHPRTGTTHPRTGTTHPRTGTTHPRTGTTHPRTGTTHPRTGTTHPRTSTTRAQPTHVRAQPTHVRAQPIHVRAQPTHVRVQPGHNPPTYGHNPPTYGHNPPTYGHNPPTYGHNLPMYGHNPPQPIHVQAQPTHVRALPGHTLQPNHTYCICTYRPTPTCMGTTHPHLVSFPDLRPVFISQPWRKINGCEIKSGCRPGNKAVKHSNNNIEEGDGPYSGIESAG